MTVNERIKLLRKEKELNQKQFAALLGITQSGASYMEQPGNNVSDSSIKSICREFGVNEEWLRHGTGDMFIEKTTFSLDDYANDNHLTSVEKEIVLGFMELAPDIRNAVYDIFRKAFEKDSTYSNAPDDPQELEKMFPPINANDTNTNTG